MKPSDSSECCDQQIVITTINYPTKAVSGYAGFEDWKLVVVGDKKTPGDWNLERCDYLSAPAQEESRYRIGRLLPWNHYARKNLGYLHSIERGAQTIVDTDDDNFPKDNWSFPAFLGRFQSTEESLGFINAYQYFTDQHIWPRGLPLEKVLKSTDYLQRLKQCESKVGVWQGLADDDPDVDAIYRMVLGKRCWFKPREPLVLGPGTVSPFNSQNTGFCRPVFPLLYLPSLVSFRFTDILRGWIAQPIMWAYGYHLGFIGATVTQERNPHDYFEDFKSEIPCYLFAEKVIATVAKAVNAKLTIEENLILSYEHLAAVNIVPNQEVDLVRAWVEDLHAAAAAGAAVRRPESHAI